MRLSISNIAWETADDDAVAGILHEYDIDAIDVAPSKYFPVIANATERDIRRVFTWWKDKGIDIVGMQSLLYGTQGLNIFGDTSSQLALLEHLHHVCRIGAGLGARWLVFGSPRNRDRTGLSDNQAHDRAVTFFRRAGNIAAQHGVTLCLEAVAPMYGANFMTTTTDCATVVRSTDHPAIRMLLDTGAIQINGEDPAKMVTATEDLVEHIHLAEPGLAPYGDESSNHILTRDLIVQHLSSRIATVEMLSPCAEPPLKAMTRALAFTRSLYQEHS